MSKVVYLFGTQHKFHGLAGNWQAGHVVSFLNRITEITLEIEQLSFGEESSSEIVASFTKNAFNGSSALGQWCDSHGFEYLALDPTDQECRERGIPDSYASRFARNNGASDKADNLDVERLNLREVEWIRRLQETDAVAWLVVIGARHVNSLSEKLRDLDWGVKVVELNWTPETQ